MGTQVAPLGLRLFLEGVEVPIIAALVGIAPSQPATASIQIVPTDAALLLLPRTLVHLFFLDQELTEADGTLADRLAEERRVDRFEVPDSRYRLLYIGEVVGLQFHKASDTRSIVLQCLDLSSYWDICYQWFADYSVGGSGLTDKTHHFVGANQHLFNNIASGTRWVLGNILTSAPENPKYRETKGLLAGYIHMLESIGGIRPRGTTYRGFRGANDFFSVAELRYQLTGMIGAVSSDVTSAQLYRAKAFRNWLRHGMASAGSLTSYRDALRLVGQYIFHDSYPNPAARFLKGGTERVLQLKSTYTDTTLGREISQLLNDAKAKLNTAKKNFRSIPSPPAAQVVTYLDGRFLLEDAKNALSAASELLTSVDTNDRARVRQGILEAHGKISLVEFNLPAFRDVPEDRMSQSQGTFIGEQVADAEAALDKIITGAQRSGTQTTQETVITSDHLFNQLILPETFFVSPPRCNVIFPDQYFQFSYSRNFMREVSRLSCQGGLGIISSGGQNANILGRYYFAPNIADVSGREARRSIYSQGTTLLPHEVFSGIIPKFEWVSDGHRWGHQAAKEAGESASDKKISYIQRLANFQFFMHRWNARTMNLTGRFNPMLVIGFPAVVIDRSTPSAAAIQAIADVLTSGQNAIFPTAYLGKLVHLTHNVNQQGGTSQAAFTQARTHRGFDDEFLGVLQRERRDLEDGAEAIIVEDLVTTARAGGSVNELDRKILQKYVDGVLKPGYRLTPNIVVKEVDIEPFGDEDPIYRLSLSDAELLGISRETFENIALSQTAEDRAGPFTDETFEAATATIDVPSSIGVSTAVRTDLGKFVTPEGAPAPERILKPGWYDAAWDVTQIGDKVYGELLGTTAITDEEDLETELFRGFLESWMKNLGDRNVAVTTETIPSGGIIFKVGDKTFVSYRTDAPSVEKAIDIITLQYGLVRERNLPVEQFIRDFTTRPIATLTEIFGSSDLEYDVTMEQPKAKEPPSIEGFHSRAFGDYNTEVAFPNPTPDTPNPEPVPGTNPLALLLTEDERKLWLNAIVNPGKDLKKIPPYLDRRGRAQQRVRAYMAELQLGRGLSAL